VPTSSNSIWLPAGSRNFPTTIPICEGGGYGSITIVAASFSSPLNYMFYTFCPEHPAIVAVGTILPVGIHARVDNNSGVLVCARLFHGGADIKHDGMIKRFLRFAAFRRSLVEIRGCLKVMGGDTHIGNAENNAFVSRSPRFITESSLFSDMEVPSE